MGKRIRKIALIQSQTLVSRVLLGVLGFATVGFLAWQAVGVVLDREPNTPPSSSVAADLAEQQRSAYTDLFSLLHRAATEGNILAEATWYTPPLTDALFAYEDISAHQREVSNVLIGIDQESILTFSILLTTEVSDMGSIAVADSAQAYDNEGRGYDILGWTRLNPLNLRPGVNQEQEAGILLVSTKADDGTSIWSNTSSNLSLILEGIEDAPKFFTWQKGLAQDINLF